MKAVVAAFNQEKALVGAFSVIVKTGCGTDGSIYSTTAVANGSWPGEDPAGAGEGPAHVPRHPGQVARPAVADTVPAQLEHHRHQQQHLQHDHLHSDGTEVTSSGLVCNIVYC